MFAKNHPKIQMASLTGLKYLIFYHIIGTWKEALQ